MKKFGKKALNDNLGNKFCDNINTEFSNNTNAFFDFHNRENLNYCSEIEYEKQMSKKLKSSNNDQKQLTDDNEFFLIKTKAKVPCFTKSNIEPLSQSKSDNFAHPKKRLFRLSELEESNLYHILRVDENTSQENIKKAFKSLCMTTHPDKGGDAEKFNKINQAYKILTHSFCRSLYDKFSKKAMDLIEFVLNLEETINLDSIDKDCDLELLKVLIMKNNNY